VRKVTKTPVHEHFEPDTVLDELAVGEVLGCGARQVVELMNAGDIKAKHVGRRGWRCTWRAVVEYLEK